jgi:hypothetical protein
LGKTAGQQLGLGQQPEHERAEPSCSRRVHFGQCGLDPLLAAARVAAAGLRPPLEKLRTGPPLPEPVLADECRRLCRRVQDPGDLFGNGGGPLVAVQDEDQAERVTEPPGRADSLPGQPQGGLGMALVDPGHPQVALAQEGQLHGGIAWHTRGDVQARRQSALQMVLRFLEVPPVQGHRPHLPVAG